MDSPLPLGYAGPHLRADVLILLARLRNEGFNIRAAGSAGKTIRVSYNERYVGYINQFVVGNGALMGYHFHTEDGYEGNACPPRFSVSVFARSNDCSSDELEAKHHRNKVYLHVLTANAGVALALRHPDGPAEVKIGNSFDQFPTVIDDVDQLVNDLTLDETTRRALVDARLGQGRFRNLLRSRFNDCCAVTKLNLVTVLRASHIKSWARSDNSERLDPENGLLLAPTIDALFDRHLISFDENGVVIRSPQLSEEVWKLLGNPGNLLHKPSKKQAEYLK